MCAHKIEYNIKHICIICTLSHIIEIKIRMPNYNKTRFIAVDRV